jgi:DNA helicase II / ATP-dependent DNA helicase PcrA
LVAEFLADLQSRFAEEAAGRGVNLVTYHERRAEFEAVFLPPLEAAELSFKRSPTAEGLAEERRFFYVGVTRASRHLEI